MDEKIVTGCDSCDWEWYGPDDGTNRDGMKEHSLTTGHVMFTSRWANRD